MTLFELGKQYSERCDAIMERIHSLTPQMKKMKGKELIIMKRRILSLYNDAAECRRCAIRLMSYSYRRNTNQKEISNEQDRI